VSICLYPDTATNFMPLSKFFKRQKTFCTKPPYGGFVTHKFYAVPNFSKNGKYCAVWLLLPPNIQTLYRQLPKPKHFCRFSSQLSYDEPAYFSRSLCGVNLSNASRSYDAQSHKFIPLLTRFSAKKQLSKPKIFVASHLNCF
jgi:hypothetical protein